VARGEETVGVMEGRCLHFEKKLNEKISDLKTDYNELKEKHDGLESELEDLKGHVIQEHIKSF